MEGYCILFLFLFLPGFAHPLNYVHTDVSTDTRDQKLIDVTKLVIVMKRRL